MPPWAKSGDAHWGNAAPAEFNSERAGFTGVRALRHGKYLRPQGQIANVPARFGFRFCGSNPSQGPMCL